MENEIPKISPDGRVLSVIQTVTLPPSDCFAPDSHHILLVVEIEASIPPEGAELLSVRFEDSPVPAHPDPESNDSFMTNRVVGQNQVSILPQTSPLEIELRSPGLPGAFGFKVDGLKNGGKLVGQAGETVELQGHAFIENTTDGVVGWSLGVTGAGADIAFLPCRNVDGGSPVTSVCEVVDPHFEGQGPGIVQNVDWEGGGLPARRFRMLRFRFTVTIPPEGSQEVILYHADGLAGSNGMSVDNELRNLDGDSLGLVSEEFTFIVEPHEILPPLPSNAVLLPNRSNFEHYFVAQTPRRDAIEVEISQQDHAIEVEISQQDPSVVGDVNFLYLRWEAPPTNSQFDFAAALRDQSGQRLVVPSRGPNESFFIRVVTFELGTGGTGNDGFGSLALDVNCSPVELSSWSTPKTGPGASGRVQGRVVGAGFDLATDFSLKGKDGTDADPHSVILLSSTEADVTFDLGSIPPGDYDLVAKESGHVATLSAAFSRLDESVGPVLQTRLSGREVFRFYRDSSLALEFSNAGDRDMIAPLFKIQGPPQTAMLLGDEPGYRGCDIGVDWPGACDSDDSDDSDGRPDPCEILSFGLFPRGPAGVVPAGESVEVPLRFSSSFVCGEPQHFQLLAFTPGIDDFIYWDILDTPTGMNDSDWNTVWPVLASRFGGRWSEYQSGLAAIATRLSRRGVAVSSTDELFRYAVRQALGRPSAAIVGRVVDSRGAPQRDVDILAIQDGVLKSSGISREDGTFAIDWLENSAIYEIKFRARKLLYNGQPATFIHSRELLPAGDLHDIELVVGPVLDALPDRPLPGCANCDERGLPLEGLRPPDSLFTLRAVQEALFIGSWDPNDKDGSSGQEDCDLPFARESVNLDDEIVFTINFENKPCLTQEEVDGCPNTLDESYTESPCGTAAAQRVGLEDQMNTLLDWDSLQLTEVQIGESGFEPEEFNLPLVPMRVGENTAFHGSTSNWSYSTIRDPKPERCIRYTLCTKVEQRIPGGSQAGGVDLDMTFVVRLDNGGAEGDGLVTVDIDSELVDPEDIETGFLLPNNPCDAREGEGEGYVSFGVRPVNGLENATIIENEVLITFDQNPGILTPPWVGEIRHFCFEDSWHPDPVDRDSPGQDRDVVLGATFTWGEHPLVGSYEVFLWAEGEPQPQEPWKTVDGSTPFFVLLEPLVTGLYHWKVVGKSKVDPQVTTEGPEWTFKFFESVPCEDGGPAPSSPSPESGATPTEELDDRLSWDPVPGALAYELSFFPKGGDGDPKGSIGGLAAPRDVNGEPTRPEFEIPFVKETFGLSGETSFEWQVVAHLSGGCSRTGPRWSVSVGDDGDTFRRGDCDQSGGVDFTDFIFFLKYEFLGEEEDVVNSCHDACDTDDSGDDDFTDSIVGLTYLFLGGVEIPAPGPLPDEAHPCGTDPTEDELTCRSYKPDCSPP